MTNYARMYRFGITPWERYATTAAASIGCFQGLAAEPADTAGLGWPMNTTKPRWYRLRLPAPAAC